MNKINLINVIICYFNRIYFKLNKIKDLAQNALIKIKIKLKLIKKNKNIKLNHNLR